MASSDLDRTVWQRTTGPTVQGSLHEHSRRLGIRTKVTNDSGTERSGLIRSAVRQPHRSRRRRRLSPVTQRRSSSQRQPSPRRSGSTVEPLRTSE